MARVRTILKRTADGRTIPAVLDDALPRAALFDIEAEWCRERVEVARTLDAAGVDDWPGSLHWSWAGKARDLPRSRLDDSGDARLIGVRADRHWQGAMLCYPSGRFSRFLSRPTPLVYVDFVEVAPWNWELPPASRVARFRGIGTYLMEAAVRASIAMGYHGRLGLHSLPQAERFYTARCGMRNFGPDTRYHGLAYLEMTPSQADAFLGARP